MFGRLGGWEILIIVLLVVILFGHSKIPGMMKNLADGINTFKKEIKNKSEKSTKKPAKAGDVPQGDKSTKNHATDKKTVKKPVKAGGKKTPGRKSTTK